MPLYSPPTSIQITGNTAGVPELISGKIYLSGGNNVSLGQTGQTIEIVGGAGGAGDGLNRIAAGTQTAGTLATVVFSNSNNVTFGMTNSSIVTASASFNQTVESQSLGMSNIGNTSGTTGIASGGQVRFLFAGGNNITLSQSLNGASGTITISAFNSVAPTGISSIVGSDATYTSGSVQFTGSNIVTVRSSANQRIVIDATQSVQTQNRFNATLGGNSTSAGAGYIEISSGTLTLAGGNNIVLSQDGNAVTISGSAFPAQTNQTLGIYVTSNTTGESSSSTYDARSLTFRGLGIASVGWSNSSLLISVPAGGGAGDGVNIVAAGTQTANTTGTVVFSNSNNFTFGMSNSSIVTASYTVPVVSNALQDVGTATGSGTNTSRFAADDHVHRGVIGVDVNGIASTFYGTVQLSAGNNISLATGGNSTRGSMQIINVLSSSAIANAVSSASNAGTLSSRFALADHAHAGLNSISIIGNTSGTTTAGAGSLVLAGGPNITLSAATAAGGMTVSVSGGAGGGGATFSAGMSNLGNTAGSSGTVSGQMAFVGSGGIYLSQSTNGANATLTISLRRGSFVENFPMAAIDGTQFAVTGFIKVPIFIPIDIRNGGLSVKTIRSYGSRVGGVTNEATCSIGFYSLANSTQLQLLSSTSHNYSLTATSEWRSVRIYDVAANIDLTGPQLYYMGIYWSTANNGDVRFFGGSPFPGVIAGFVNSGTDQTAATNNTSNLLPFQGSYSATTNAMPGTVNRTEILGGNEAFGLPYVALMEI